MAEKVPGLRGRLESSSQNFLLELTINGKPTGELIELNTRTTGCQLIETSALSRAGLYNGSDNHVCLQSLGDLASEVNFDDSTLRVFADTGRTRTSHDAASRSFARELTGLTSTYSLSAQRYDDTNEILWNVFGDLSTQFHSPYGRLENDMLLFTGSNGTDVERFRTVYQYDFVDSLTQLSIGDSFSRAPGWGRLTSFAGLQIGTDLSMDPDQSYLPFRTLKALLRESAEVNVRVNGSVRERASVDPGINQFNVRPETGLNEVELTIRDGSGIVRIEDFSFFSSRQALAAGVTDYSVSLGVPREITGRGASYDGELFASTYVRHGLSDTLTGEAYMEMNGTAVVAGGGAKFNVGKLGILDLSSGFSRSRENDFGQMMSARFDRQTRRGNFEIQARLASDDYTDTLAVRGVPFPDVSIRASFGQFTDYGSFRMSYTEQSDAELADRRFTAFSWNKAFSGNRFSAFASAYHDHERDEQGLTIGLRAILGNYSARLSGSRAVDQDLLSLQAARARTGAEGLQWNVQLTRSEDFDTLQADVQQATSTNELFLNAGKFGDVSLVTGGIRGGIVAANGNVALVRQLGTASALVQTGSATGVDVYNFNRKVGQSDKNGRLLISDLRAFETNTLTLDPEQLPMDHVGDAYKADFIPKRGISVVEFEVHEDTSLGFNVYKPDGTPLEAGSVVRLKGSGTSCMVGYEGRVPSTKCGPHSW